MAAIEPTTDQDAGGVVNWLRQRLAFLLCQADLQNDLCNLVGESESSTVHRWASRRPGHEDFARAPKLYCGSTQESSSDGPGDESRWFRAGGPTIRGRRACSSRFP